MRFKELAESEMTEDQLAVYREICSGPRGRIGAPTKVLLRCPELAKRTHAVSRYINSGSSLPNRIREFAILITARCWSAQFEWHAHYPLALKAGLSSEVAAELAQGKYPSGMKDDEAAAYQFCTELHQNKDVSDAAFDAVIKQLGENGAVDLLGVAGYYTLVSMVLKVNQEPLPAGVPLPLPPLG